MYRRILPLFFALLLLPMAADAQRYIDQFAVEHLLNIQAENLDALPEVYYEYYVFDEPRKNTVIARAAMYRELGEGDMELGRKRSQLVELINRTSLGQLALGDTVIVPTEFEVDFRAYSPFPRYYPGARNEDKLFIIHKEVQAFAAYEYGVLQRWGIINTGDPEEYPTPNGRFNFNWKEEYRVSSLSPPDEDWEMYWVFNFHDARGIHIHQYPMPTGGPTSRGCVRMIDTDAEWVYNWADAWTTSTGRTDVRSRQGRLLEPGSMVLVLGDDPEGDPNLFDYGRRYPVLNRVTLPQDPYDVEPGTNQQRITDRWRSSR